MTRWPKLNPGDLRLPFTVLAPQPSTDASGASVEYVKLLTGRAAVDDDERGQDVHAAGEVVSQEMLNLRTWFDARVKSNMQLETDHGRWIIQQVINVRKMNVIMRLVCIAIGADE